MDYCEFIITMLILYISLIITSCAATTPTNQDLVVAIEEMQKANYYTFVMLINMSPLPDQSILGNITFLMPNDKTLSKANLLQQYSTTSDFLLYHSIPSTLLFENLLHIPSGSLIPSSIPDYMFKISNGGRRDFFLNKIKIISPNICTLGSSIRCHGIDGVLDITQQNNTITSLPATCSTSTNHPSDHPPMPSSPMSAAPPTLSNPNQPPAAAPSPGKSSAAGSLEISLKSFVTMVMMLSLSIMGMPV